MEAEMEEKKKKKKKKKKEVETCPVYEMFPVWSLVVDFQAQCENLFHQIQRHSLSPPAKIILYIRVGRNQQVKEHSLRR